MKEKLGPTGKYPDGKIREDDKGGLNIEITNSDRHIIIRFNTNVAWLAISPEGAIELAEDMLARASKIKRSRC